MPVLAALQVLLLLDIFNPAKVLGSPQRPGKSANTSALMTQGAALRRDGKVTEAIATYQTVIKLASTENDLTTKAKALLGISGCYLRTFRYREALNSGQDALQNALTAKNDEVAGAAAGNKSSLYYQVGDNTSALAASDQAVSLLEHSPNKTYYAKVLLIRGDIQAELGQPGEAARTAQQAIDVASGAHLSLVEASAQGHLGARLLDSGKLADSEKALKRAYQLFSEAHDDENLAGTTANLAELALAKKDYPEALRLVNAALAESRRKCFIPTFWPLLTKANILLAMGRQQQALAVFSEATLSANRWRQDVLPGDATQTRTAASLAAVYQGYVELAADLAIRRHDTALMRQAFETVAVNRVWTLREQFLSELGRNLKLPSRYYELLTELKEKQALVTLGTDAKSVQANQRALQQVRFELTDIENKVGLDNEKFAALDEKDSHRTSLTRLQQSLREEELLLNFCLGERKSFVWAVTQNSVNVYELPSAHQLSEDARAFAGAVQHGQSFGAQGQRLSRDLFGTLPAKLTAHRDWSLVADGALLDGIPFSALPDPRQSDSSPLIEAHSLRLLPAALLRLAPKAVQTGTTFVAVADPIYNYADPRRRTNSVKLVRVSAQAPSALSLGRLVGSDREVRAASVASGISHTTFLTGQNASGALLAETLASQRPEVVHFAVHIVSPEETGSGKKAAAEAALALSLAPDNMPELLTKENVATFRVPGSLVVLSGCASEQGEVLPNAGLVGLSRAWLSAGASAVLVTAWPTPDDSGAFFQSFYSHLRQAPGSMGERAAAALRAAQMDMQASSGYRLQARYWAAYSLISKE